MIAVPMMQKKVMKSMYAWLREHIRIDIASKCTSTYRSPFLRLPMPFFETSVWRQSVPPTPFSTSPLPVLFEWSVARKSESQMFG